MFRDLLSPFPYVNLVLAGELIFFVTFSGSLFWVFRKGGKSYYDKIADIPLEEEN